MHAAVSCMGLTVWLSVAGIALAQDVVVRSGDRTTAQRDRATALGEGLLTPPPQTAGAPLWSFAWVSDMHLDASRRELVAKALHYINAELKPHFVLITGDNNALPAAPADPQRPEPLGLRRQRYLQVFLQEHLKCPYAILPGDNWPEEFDKVFGAKQYSFDYGGLHFLVLDSDRAYHGARTEGLSVFDESTWAWIRRDLDRHARKPTIVAIHEPVCPATFLDAGRLRGLLDRHPQVIAALQGHLHADLEFLANGRTYLVAPSLGKSPLPAFKWVKVYPEVLVLHTIQYRRSEDQFRVVERRQRIEVPRLLRQGLSRPSGSRLVMANYDAVPPHPHRDDPTLAGRVGELMEVIRKSIGNDVWSWR